MHKFTLKAVDYCARFIVVWAIVTGGFWILTLAIGGSFFENVYTVCVFILYASAWLMSFTFLASLI